MSIFKRKARDMNRGRVVTLAYVALIAVMLAWYTPAFAVEDTNESDATWECSLDGVAATLTLCKTAPNNGRRLYIRSIVAQSSTATAGTWILRYGTGTNCGTGTTSLFPSAATAASYVAPANNVAPTVIQMDPPLTVPVGKDLCVLGVATNTTKIHIRGYLKP